ncbi:translation initiation factor IF-2-like [Pipistrellus kuhlii]|uniref:translation initiation factor IF-2-like n=1 Tax=Pipistrellus kuhlii TaxID=59472 RepID=UPI001E2702F9|nr:translation initiation factor IF-2-like [Pipistrellus kuhlii]
MMIIIAEASSSEEIEAHWTRGLSPAHTCSGRAKLGLEGASSAGGSPGRGAGGLAGHLQRLRRPSPGPRTPGSILPANTRSLPPRLLAGSPRGLELSRSAARRLPPCARDPGRGRGEGGPPRGCEETPVHRPGDLHFGSSRHLLRWPPAPLLGAWYSGGGGPGRVGGGGRPPFPPRPARGRDAGRGEACVAAPGGSARDKTRAPGGGGRGRPGPPRAPAGSPRLSPHRRRRPRAARALARPRDPQSRAARGGGRPRPRPRPAPPPGRRVQIRTPPGLACRSRGPPTPGAPGDPGGRGGWPCGPGAWGPRSLWCGAARAFCVTEEAERQGRRSGGFQRAA